MNLNKVEIQILHAQFLLKLSLHVDMKRENMIQIQIVGFILNFKFNYLYLNFIKKNNVKECEFALRMRSTIQDTRPEMLVNKILSILIMLGVILIIRTNIL